MNDQTTTQDFKAGELVYVFDRPGGQGAHRIEVFERRDDHSGGVMLAGYRHNKALSLVTRCKFQIGSQVSTDECGPATIKEFNPLKQLFYVECGGETLPYHEHELTLITEPDTIDADTLAAIDAEIKSMPLRDAFIQLTFDRDDVSIARFDGPSGRTSYYPKMTPSSWRRLDDLLLRIKWTGKHTSTFGDTLFAYRANPDSLDPTGMIAAHTLFTDLSAEIAAVADYVVSTAAIPDTFTRADRDAALNDKAVTDKASSFTNFIENEMDGLDSDVSEAAEPPTPQGEGVTETATIGVPHTVTYRIDFNKDGARSTELPQYHKTGYSALPQGTQLHDGKLYLVVLYLPDVPLPTALREALAEVRADAQKAVTG